MACLAGFNKRGCKIGSEVGFKAGYPEAGFRPFLTLGLFALLLLGPMASAAEPADSGIKFYAISAGGQVTEKTASSVDYALKIEKEQSKVFLRAYLTSVKKFEKEITTTSFQVPITLQATGFDAGRKVCIAKDYDKSGKEVPDEYTLATFDNRQNTNINSVLGGICNQNSIARTVTGTQWNEVAKVYPIGATSVASGYNLFVKDKTGAKKIIPTAGDGFVTATEAPAIFASNEIEKKIVRIYTWVASFGTGDKYILKIWFREDDAPAPIPAAEPLGDLVIIPSTGNPIVASAAADVPEVTTGSDFLVCYRSKTGITGVTTRPAYFKADGAAMTPTPGNSKADCNIELRNKNLARLSSLTETFATESVSLEDGTYSVKFLQSVTPNPSGGVQITVKVAKGTATGPAPAQTGSASTAQTNDINVYILPAGRKIMETWKEKTYTFDVKTEPTNKITATVEVSGQTQRFVLENGRNVGGDALKYTGRNFCIIKDGDSYVVATFADGVEYGIDSALGGICEEGALNIKINQGQILAGTEISALDKKYDGYKLEALLPATGAANVQIKDGKGTALLESAKQEDQVSAGTPKAKKADARRKNGLKSEAIIYTAIAQDYTAVAVAPTGTTATTPASPANRLLVGFRDTLVKQDLVDLFVTATQGGDTQAHQSTEIRAKEDEKKVKTITIVTDGSTKSKADAWVCYRTNQDTAENGDAKPVLKNADGAELKPEKDDYKSSDKELSNYCGVSFLTAKRSDTRAGSDLSGMSLPSGEFKLMKFSLERGTYTATYSNSLTGALKKYLQDENREKAEEFSKEERRAKVRVAKPFVGIQSKQKSRVLFVVNPVTTEEAKAYETANKGKKAVATPGADGKTASIILYLDNDLMKTTYNLRGAIFPESLVRLGWTGKIKDGWADIYVPEFDHASDLYAAFIGTAEKDVLDKNVDKEKSTTDKTIDTTVSTWWGSPVTAEAYDTPPRAFATIREYEKVCGLGADVIEYFSCTSGKWKLESPNIELTEAEKKGKDTAALKKLVADRTAKKVEELKAYKQADPAIALLRRSKTRAEFEAESCSGGKIYIDHADDIGMYKTPRFYALWTNILDALKESGAFQTYAKNGGILKVQVKPLQTYDKALDAEDKKKAAELAAEAKKRTTKPTEVQKDIAQQYSRLFLANSPFASTYAPFHPFTFAFHRVAAPSGKTGLVQVANGMIQAWAMAPGANNVFLNKKVELLKQYLHPNPPAANDQPLGERYKALYKKAAFDESYKDVAAVLEIRLPEKLGMEMSGYAYAGENKVPQSSRTSDGEKKLQEGFLTQMECTDSTVNGRYDIDPETKTTFERKEPVKAGEKIKCVNLPVTDAAKSWDADVALLEKEKKGEATGADALEVVKACRAIHNYYFQDFGITEKVPIKGSKAAPAKDKIILNNLDLSKKYLYDITICPDKESCDAAPIIRPSDLLDIKLVQKKEKPAPVATKPAGPQAPAKPQPGAPSKPTQPGQQPQQPGGQQPPAASPVKPPAEPPKTGGDEPAKPAYEKTPQRQEFRTIPARVSQTGSGGSSSGTDTKADVTVKTDYGTAQFNPVWLSQMQPSGWPGGWPQGYNPMAYYNTLTNPYPTWPGHPYPGSNPYIMQNIMASMYYPIPQMSPWMTLAQSWPSTMYGGYPYYMPTASGAMQMYNLMLGDNFRMGFIKTSADGRKDFKMWAGQLALGGFRIGGFGFGSLRVVATVDKLEPGESVEFVLFTPEGQPPTEESINLMQPPAIEIGSVEEAPQQLVNTAGTAPAATPAAQQGFLLPAAFVILVIGVGWMWLNRGRRKAG